MVRSAVDATGYGTTTMLGGAEGSAGEMEKQLMREMEIHDNFGSLTLSELFSACHICSLNIS